MSRHVKEKNKYSKERAAEKIEKSDENFNEKARRKKPQIKKKKSYLKLIVFFIFLAIFIFSAINLIRWGIYNKKSANLIEDIIEESFSETDLEDNNEEISKNPVNFDSLKNINSDVVAWIKIDDTSVNYPIVQTTDNEYYLHKDINKNYSTCGWIFMDFKNSENFIDKNTVLYGHNIKSGLMFADLTKILNNKLGDEVTIEIYTPTEKLDYIVFSSYMEEPEDYAIKSNIVDEQAQEKYIKDMLQRSSIKYNVVPDKSDKLLTLSTCDSTGKNRILVHAVNINKEEFN